MTCTNDIYTVSMHYTINYRIVPEQQTNEQNIKHMHVQWTQQTNEQNIKHMHVHCAVKTVTLSISVSNSAFGDFTV